MDSFLRIALPVYFLCYVVFLVVIRSMAVSRNIGKSPVVLTDSNTLHGLINNYFKVLILFLLAYLLVFAFFPVPSVFNQLHYFLFIHIPYLDNMALKIAGLALLVISFFIVFFAQIHMRNSFRIGIDHGTQTELVAGGLFRFSRNPIYVGMFGSIVGLLLVTPNIFTLLLTIIAFVLIQVQVRLEEEYLYKMHGHAFVEYKQKVRRFF